MHFGLLPIAIVSLALVLFAWALTPAFRAVYAVYCAWSEIGWWKRIIGIILFIPYICIVCCLIPWFGCYGQSGATNDHFASMSCSNLIMASAVLGVFILPIFAYLGTQLALLIFHSKDVAD